MMKETRKSEKGAAGFLAAALALLLLSGLPLWSAPEDKGGPDRAVATEALVWPSPPDPPRIRYVTQFSKASDVAERKKKKKKWFERLAGVKKREGEQKIIQPYGIAVDSRGRVYVADTVGLIHVFDLQGRKVSMITGSGTHLLRNPVSVAVDSQDRLFVTDSRARAVFCFNSDGKPAGMIGGEHLGVPVGIAVDSKRGRLYVTDVKQHRLAVFDLSTFNFIQYIGEPGVEPGQFNRPAYVAVDKRGFVYVTDMHNHRVQIFNRRGKFVRTFGQHCRTSGCFSKPKGIAVDSEGHIYVADAEFNNFQIFDQQGNALLFVGTMGKDPGQFILLTGLYIDQNDRIFTTEQVLGRVQVFQYISQPHGAEERGD
jgi:DNA-binding beta-propeller fold protein YncE